MTVMTPREIVHELDKHIIGQNKAKRAVAIALRNRWRRMQIDPQIRDEISPKNILMIGPTGVGKTEIARRLARLANAPFIKVEATKFTEVGYVGRDVESIIRDLTDVAVNLLREEHMQRVKHKAAELAEERILDQLLTAPKETSVGGKKESSDSITSTRQIFRKRLREKELDDREIEIDLKLPRMGVEIMAPPGMEEMTSQLQGMFSNMGNEQKRTQRLKIKDAIRKIEEEEASKLVNEDEVKALAVDNVQQMGIVFLDEIDKVAKRAEHSGADVSREGVQRDLLPLIEGCTVSTKYGMVRTDHILFIASGAFHLSKPSDLIPELQGRLPIRVELSELSPNDFKKILVEPDGSLTTQYEAMLATEGVTLDFSEDGIERIAQLAWEVNEATENIGARRLHTVMEKLVDDISFCASEEEGKKVMINSDYVDEHLKDIALDKDLSQYIL